MESADRSDQTATKPLKGSQGATQPASVDAAEIMRFAAMAETWWDPEGQFKPLHRLNPTRVSYIEAIVAGHFGRDMAAKRPFSGLKLLDIGCGGGLVAEPMARRGAEVLGADATEKNIPVARAHAAEQDLTIDYRFATAEELAGDGQSFDVVLALEVVEHVADLGSFLGACRKLVKPGGVFIFSTINRTNRSFLAAIVAAEYIFRWLPRGTHDWKKFLKPSELAGHLGEAGLEVAAFRGMTFNPIKDSWSLTKDLSINYLGYALTGSD